MFGAVPADREADAVDDPDAAGPAGDQEDPAEVQGRQGEAERRAAEVLPREQDQPAGRLPAAARHPCPIGIAVFRTFSHGRPAPHPAVRARSASSTSTSAAARRDPTRAATRIKHHTPTAHCTSSGMNLNLSAANAELRAASASALPYFIADRARGRHRLVPGAPDPGPPDCRPASAPPNAQMQAITRSCPIVLRVHLLRLQRRRPTIYFVVSNVWRIGQQHFVLNKMYDEAARPARRRRREARRQARPPSEGRPTPPTNGRAEVDRPTTGRPANGAAPTAPSAERRRRNARRSGSADRMDWIEVTARTVDDAKELALDRLGRRRGRARVRGHRRAPQRPVRHRPDRGADPGPGEAALAGEAVRPKRRRRRAQRAPRRAVRAEPAEPRRRGRPTRARRRATGRRRAGDGERRRRGSTGDAGRSAAARASAAAAGAGGGGRGRERRRAAIERARTERRVRERRRRQSGGGRGQRCRRRRAGRARGAVHRRARAGDGLRRPRVAHRDRRRRRRRCTIEGDGLGAAGRPAGRDAPGARGGRAGRRAAHGRRAQRLAPRRRRRVPGAPARGAGRRSPAQVADEVRDSGERAGARADERRRPQGRARHRRRDRRCRDDVRGRRAPAPGGDPARREPGAAESAVRPSGARRRRSSERARRSGSSGPGPVEPHLAPRRGLRRGAPRRRSARRPARFADLGTGGGVPGLVLAVRWPERRGVLVEPSAAGAARSRGPRSRARAGRPGRGRSRAGPRTSAHEPDLPGALRAGDRPELRRAGGHRRDRGRARRGRAGSLVVSEPPGAGRRPLAGGGPGRARVRRRPRCRSSGRGTTPCSAKRAAAPASSRARRDARQTPGLVGRVPVAKRHRSSTFHVERRARSVHARERRSTSARHVPRGTRAAVERRVPCEHPSQRTRAAEHRGSGGADGSR